MLHDFNWLGLGLIPTPRNILVSASVETYVLILKAIFGNYKEANRRSQELNVAMSGSTNLFPFYSSALAGVLKEARHFFEIHFKCF